MPGHRPPHPAARDTMMLGNILLGGLVILFLLYMLGMALTR